MPAVGDLSAALVQTPVQTSAYTAKPFEFVRTDTSGGSFTVTLPLAPASNTVIGIKQVTTSGSNTTTVVCSGADVFNKYGGATTMTLTLTAQGATVSYRSGVWLIVSDDLPLAQLDTRYATASAADFAPSGLTGATAASRYAGGTASGAPASGTFAVGDFVIDRSGAIWVCTASGSPGTWRSIPAASQQFASDSGYVAWTGDIFTGSTSFSAANIGIAQTSGAICLTRLDIPQPVTANGYLSFQWRQPTGGSPANSYVGLYNSSGTQLFVSSDLTSTTSNLLRLSTGVTSFTAGPLYVASLIGTQGSTAGGLGFFIGGLQFGAPGAVAQIGTIPYRCTSLAGSATSLPPSLTLSSFNSRTYYYVWAAID